MKSSAKARVNTCELADSELEDVSGGLLKEIGQTITAVVDALAGAYANAAFRAGCLINPANGSFGSCPQNPPPI